MFPSKTETNRLVILIRLQVKISSLKVFYF